MAAGKLNLRVEQGTLFHKTLTWKDGVGNSVDMTGATALLQVRESVDSPVLLEMSTANSKVRLGATNGKVELILSDSQTLALTFERGVYDLLITFPTGSMRLVEGRMVVSPAVTKVVP